MKPHHDLVVRNTKTKAVILCGSCSCTVEMEKIGDEIQDLANLKSAVAAASHIKPHFNRKIRACA